MKNFLSCDTGTAWTAPILPELGEKYEGKVRDVYVQNGRRILITTDRISAFDRVLGLIPFKGQVLNQLSAWWFEQTADHRAQPSHQLYLTQRDHRPRGAAAARGNCRARLHHRRDEDVAVVFV
jgi:phosphoribosylaminoimidazole-succinocarboxamide synthase